MKHNGIVSLALIFAFVPLAGLRAQVTTDRKPVAQVTKADPAADLKKQVDQLATQIRNQRKLTREQGAVISETRKLADQQAKALKDQQAAAAAQAATIDQQTAIVNQQAKDQAKVQKTLYVAGSLILLVVALCLVTVREIRKKPAPSMMENQPITIVEEQPIFQEPAQPAAQLKLMGSKILPNTLVNPARDLLRRSAKGSGGIIPYTLRLHNGMTFSCLAIFKSESCSPMTRFVDYPEVPETKWENRNSVAVSLLHDQEKVS